MVLLLILIAVVGGCARMNENGKNACKTTSDCLDGYTCLEGTCIADDQIDAAREDGETDEPGNGLGDGSIEAAGSEENPPRHEPDILIATCGDGEIVEGFESCDDGNTVTETSCEYGVSTCLACSDDCSEILELVGSYCGDGIVDEQEACDDGNTEDESSCAYGTASCRACNADCTEVLDLTGGRCGDGNTDEDEVCDDGNTEDESSCEYGTATCTYCNADCTEELKLTGAFCGDRNVDEQEACDDGNTESETACEYGDSTCTRCNHDCTEELDLTGGVCGDGDIADEEKCDDGNRDDEDGCDGDCQIEDGFGCVRRESGDSYCTGCSQPVFVDVDSEAENPDGSSWDSAFNDLQKAIDWANELRKSQETCDVVEVWVAKGVYTPTSDGNRDKSFVLRNRLEIYGGFIGTETSREQRDWENNPTVLSGDLNGNDYSPLGNREDNSSRVVVAENVGALSSIDGFVVTGGYAGNGGGGIYCRSSDLVIENIIIRENDSENGGGMYITDGSPRLANVVFDSNTSLYRGGGLYNDGGAPVLSHVEFEGNGAMMSGGGMYNLTNGNNPAYLTNVVFRENSAHQMPFDDNGGGLFTNGVMNLVNVDFIKNSAGDNGGGMYVDEPGSLLVNVRFLQNQAIGANGGGLYARGNVQMVNGVFSGNEASGNGGGVFYSGYSWLLLTNVTMFGNTASQEGGGLYCSGGPDDYLRIRNSVLWGNSSDIEYTNMEPNAIYNSCFEGVDFGESNTIDCCPDGSDTPFIDADGADDIIGTEDDDLRLQTGSPAIDSGDNSYFEIDDFFSTDIELSDTDLIGEPRIVNDAIDMGAYEDQGTL